MKIDPIRLAASGQEISGTIAFVQCKRLMKLLLTQEGEIEYRLKFAKDEAAVPLMTGLISAVLPLECQRCQSVVEVKLAISPKTSPVVSEAQIPSLPKEYEPLVTKGEPVSLIDMVEEEILLALPMVPRHGEGECPVPLPDYLR